MGQPPHGFGEPAIHRVNQGHAGRGLGVAWSRLGFLKIRRLFVHPMYIGLSLNAYSSAFRPVLTEVHEHSKLCRTNNLQIAWSRGTKSELAGSQLFVSVLFTFCQRRPRKCGVQGPIELR